MRVSSREVFIDFIFGLARHKATPCYEIPNSVESEGARASSLNNPTSSYLRAPSCLATRSGRRCTVCRWAKGRTGRKGVSHPNSYAGLNGPRLIRHKRLILKNSSRDKSFLREPRIPFALRPLAFHGSYGASERSRLSRHFSFH